MGERSGKPLRLLKTAEGGGQIHLSGCKGRLGSGERSGKPLRMQTAADGQVN
jgi:hypothetical protein